MANLRCTAERPYVTDERLPLVHQSLDVWQPLEGRESAHPRYLLGCLEEAGPRGACKRAAHADPPDSECGCLCDIDERGVDQ